MIEEEHGYWIESNEPIEAGEYPERPLVDERCKECPNSEMRYWTFRMNGSKHRDRFKSIICHAGKVPICRNGFIQPEEFEC